MCQVGEDFEGQLQRADTDRLSKKCVKCKDALPVVVIKAGDSYCRECFREYFIHKFRAMLGKNRLIFPGEKVLLAVSGGPSSCSMLSQVQEGLSQKAHKKLRFLPGIVYIDEGGAVGQSGEQRRRAAAELRAVFQASGFPFHMLPLEQVLSLPSVERADPRPQSEQPAGSYRAAVDHYLQSQAEGAGSSPQHQHQHQRGSPPESAPEAETQQDQHDSPLDGVPQAETRRLQQLMASAQTLTAREQLLTSLRQQLLVHTARALGYSKLMMGDSCTRLAVKLLLNISLGRGAHLAQDTGFSDSRYGDIISVRPMRDYSAKEIAYYNRLFGVPSVFIPGLDTKAKEKASIQSLTETFVTKLQEDFPSTVSTIYRTSEKLQTSCKGSSGEDACARCLLCVCALDTSAESATAFQATLLSEQLSQSRAAAAADDVTTQHPGPASAGPCGGRGGGCSSEGGQACEVGGEAAAAAAAGGGGGGCCSGSARAVEASAIRKLLCYSCQLTIKDMSSLDYLPDHILSEAQRRQNRSRMRAEISEFLLDQADGDH